MRRCSKESVSFEATAGCRKFQWIMTRLRHKQWHIFFWGGGCRNWGNNSGDQSDSSSSEKCWSWILNIEFVCSCVLPIHSTAENRSLCISASYVVRTPKTFKVTFACVWTCEGNDSEPGIFCGRKPVKNIKVLFWPTLTAAFLYTSFKQQAQRGQPENASI